MTLLRGLQPHIPEDWKVDSGHMLNLEANVTDIIRMVIQPQLGHADEETSMIYLRWFKSLLANSISVDYDYELDDSFTADVRKNREKQ